MHQAIILLGGNVGQVSQTFAQVRQVIAKEVGNITHQTPLYRSPAWGYQSTSDFYNQVIEVQTNKNPHQLLEFLLQAEKDAGRIRTQVQGYTDRIIDLDILFYDQLVYASPQLIIPHPRLHLRRFCLVPLHSFMPEYVHPLLHQTISQLLQACTDESEVVPV